jgi:hypothetical protein
MRRPNEHVGRSTHKPIPITERGPHDFLGQAIFMTASIAGKAVERLSAVDDKL